MTTSSQNVRLRSRFARQAYDFVLDALGRAQEIQSRRKQADNQCHVTGAELLEGFRELAIEEFGGMALVVMHQWGLQCTNDVGYIVWDMIQQGRMRKTDQDQLTDFFDVYQFESAFAPDDYQPDLKTSC